jgi:hypothetical protein
MQGGIAKLIVEPFKIGWPSSVELFGAPFIKDDSRKFENFRELSDQLLWERVGSVNQKNGPAERVQALHVLLPSDRIESPPLDFC